MSLARLLRARDDGFHHVYGSVYRGMVSTCGLVIPRNFADSTDAGTQTPLVDQPTLARVRRRLRIEDLRANVHEYSHDPTRRRTRTR